MNKILFAGTPDIAVPLLKKLASEFEVVGVLTAVDKRQGRSDALVPSPVKLAASELNLPVLQFESLKSEAREAVKTLGADTLVTFAFGKIFGPKFLALFQNGTFNVHPSALPMFRGPSPIQATILNGLKKASISLQVIGEKMDEGAIFDRMDFDLDGTENTESLTRIVSLKAPDFVSETLHRVFESGLKPIDQTGEASYCTMLDKTMAHIDFNETVLQVHGKIRALYPWPKACAEISGKEVFITGVWGSFNELNNCDCMTENFVSAVPGQIVEIRKDRGIGVRCSDGVIWINALQLPSKKEMDFKSFINGNSWIREGMFK